MRCARSLAIVFVLSAGLGSCSDTKVDQVWSTPEGRVERALQDFATAVREDAPVVKELDKAIIARLSDADAVVIIRQFLSLIEAAGRHEDAQTDPQFLALMQRLGDLPYFNTFAEALDGTAQVPGPLTPTRTPAVGSRRAALGSLPTCDSDCAMNALHGYAVDTGMSVIGTFVGTFDLVANGNACGDQLVGLYACLAQDNCGRVELWSLASSCLQVGAALTLVGLGVTNPVVVGAVGIAGALSGALVARRSVNQEVEQCQAYQEASCCVGKITCGSGCCEQGFACLPGGVCARNSTAGCEPSEKPCGIYCCPEGAYCDPVTTTCRPKPRCDFPTSACGGTCCTQAQTCAPDGTCRACAADALCGAGTLCCQSGTFCSAVGQCLREPEGGCGPLCGVMCCAPGQTCASGVEASCEGEAAVCPDGECTPGVETPLVCPADCPSECGDKKCQDWEIASTCPADCGGEVGVDGGVVGVDGGTDPITGCGSVGDCSTFCNQVEARALEQCEAEGGYPYAPFDDAACVAACECMVSAGCPELLPCVLDFTCEGCSSITCDQELYTCDWGGWLKCAK